MGLLGEVGVKLVVLVNCMHVWARQGSIKGNFVMVDEYLVHGNIDAVQASK